MASKKKKWEKYINMKGKQLFEGKITRKQAHKQATRHAKKLKIK